MVGFKAARSVGGNVGLLEALLYTANVPDGAA